MSHFMALILCWSLLSFSAGAPSVEVGEVFTGDVNTYEGVTMTVVEDSATPDGIRVEVLNTTAKAIEMCIRDRAGPTRSTIRRAVAGPTPRQTPEER